MLFYYNLLSSQPSFVTFVSVFMMPEPMTTASMRVHFQHFDGQVPVGMFLSQLVGQDFSFRDAADAEEQCRHVEICQDACGVREDRSGGADEEDRLACEARGGRRQVGLGLSSPGSQGEGLREGDFF
jgi:hypothetical protein